MEIPGAILHTGYSIYPSSWLTDSYHTARGP